MANEPETPQNGKKDETSWLPAFRTQQLFTRLVVFILLLMIDLWFFKNLIEQTTIKEGTAVEPAIIALLGTVVGAVTMIVGLAGKDFFNPRD